MKALLILPLYLAWMAIVAVFFFSACMVLLPIALGEEVLRGM